MPNTGRHPPEIRERAVRLVFEHEHEYPSQPIRYTERVADAGEPPASAAAGDSYDNALAESVIGLFKTELVRNKGPWKGSMT